jgi:hypothetical protein
VASSFQHSSEIVGSSEAGNFLTTRGIISFSRRTIFHAVS